MAFPFGSCKLLGRYTSVMVFISSSVFLLFILDSYNRIEFYSIITAKCLISISMADLKKGTPYLSQTKRTDSSL